MQTHFVRLTSLGIKNQQLTHVITIILRAETALRVLEALSAPPNGEMRTNLPQTWWNAYVSCIVISSYLEKYGNILRRTNISTFWSLWDKKYEKTYRQTDRTICVSLSALISEFFFARKNSFRRQGHIYWYGKCSNIDITTIYS